MRRYAIIATRHPKEVRGDGTTTVGNLYCFLTLAGWEVTFVENADSMFEVYNETSKKLDLHSNDQIIMCHDDIEVINSVESFNHLLSVHLEKPDTGFVGVAGSRVITSEEIAWFRCAQRHESGGGVVYHGKTLETMYPSGYGPHTKAVCMDGVFLATTGRVLNTINLQMPEGFVGKWDWYDAIYTFQAFKKKLKNIIAPIILRHESGGRYPQEWHEDLPKFRTLFSKDLPAVAR